MRRSMLFLPGNTPSILINGDCLGADCLIFDLEDAVSPAEKDSARILVRNAIADIGFDGIETVIRINAIDTPYWQDDLRQLIALRPSFIMPPKVGCAEHVLTVDRFISELEAQHGIEPGTIALIPLIETALGVENAFEIARCSPRVAAIFLGAEDLTADLRSKRTKGGEEIAYARSRIVSAARAANIDVYDTPFTDVNDDEGALEDAMLAKSLGFTGKASISPRHVQAINSAFSPSRADIDYACEVVEAIERAAQQGKGAVSLRGKMIDAPIVDRAKRTIADAKALGLLGGNA